MVALGTDGRIISQGSVADALAHNKALATELKHEEEAVELEEHEEDAEAPVDKKGKLVVAEEIELGHVSRDACTCQNSGPDSLSLHTTSYTIPGGVRGKVSNPILGAIHRRKCR